MPQFTKSIGRSTIPVCEPQIGPREIAYVTDAVKSGWVSSKGRYLTEFAQGFADYIGCKEAIPVSSGTAALHLAVHALGIGKGDQVLVPDMTFVAPAHAVLQTGATPVFVDVDEDTWCIDPELAERAINSKTRAIVAVHLYGQPAAVDQLRSLADRHGLYLIEDCAEAHGAKVGDARVGSLGDVNVFSFFGNKIITTGEGGMVTTDNAQLAWRVRYLKDHGMFPERRYYHEEVAFNYRMTNLQAALGLAQLEQIDAFLERRRAVHEWYEELLGSDPRIRLNREAAGTTHVFWMNCVVLDPFFCRDQVMLELAEKGVETRPFFVPMRSLPHLREFPSFGRAGSECGVSKYLAQNGFSLPSSSNLTRETVEYICGALFEVLWACEQEPAAR